MTTSFTLQDAVSAPVVLWATVPPPANPGCRSIHPFTIFLSAEDTDEHIVHLYAENSKSSPYQAPRNKWSHLIPQWRFTDLSGNVIEDLIMPAGMTASAQFYYVDDMPISGCDPVLLWLTVDYSEYPVGQDVTNCSLPASGFVNSLVGLCVPYYINSVDPAYLDVTRDGVNPMFDSYWRYASIPHVVTVEGDVSEMCSLSCEGFLHYIPDTNTNGVLGGPVTRSLTGAALSALTWYPGSSMAYLSAVDSDSLEVGGYLRGYVQSDDTTTGTVIAASATVYYTPLYRHITDFWISNPENRTLNKVYYPCLPSTMHDSITSYFESSKTIGVNGFAYIYDTPYITQIPADNPMGLSGFGGIYGIAVDPCYGVWCTDGEMDSLYKFSAAGQLLSTIYLPLLTSSSLMVAPSTLYSIPISASSYPLKQIRSIVADDHAIYVGVATGTVTYNTAQLEIYDKNFNIISTTPLYWLSPLGSFDIKSLLKYKNYILVIGKAINAFNTILVYDVTYLNNPTLVNNDTVISVNDDYGSMQCVGDILYVLTKYIYNTIYVFNLAYLPTSISLLEYRVIPLVDPSLQWFDSPFFVKDNRLYVSRSGKIYVYEMSDYTLTQLSSSMTTWSSSLSSSKVHVIDDYLYTSTEPFAARMYLKIYDVSDPGFPVLVENTSIPYDGMTQPQIFDGVHMVLSNGHFIASPPRDEKLSYVYLSSYDVPALIGEICLEHKPGEIALTRFTSDDVVWIVAAPSFSETGVTDFEVAAAYSPFGGSTPAGISLDGNLNMWISLVDSVRVLKFDSMGNLQLYVEPNGVNNNPYPVYTGPEGVDPQYKPTLAETDKENNVWVSYTNSLCSGIHKYNTDGIWVTSITLPTCSNPMDMLVDYAGNLWVTLTQHSGPYYREGWVRMYTGTTLISNIPAVHPEYITMDFNGNVWFTQDFNTVTRVTPASVLTHFTVGTAAAYAWMTAGELLEYNALEGIAADIYNRVFVINSIENMLYEIVDDVVVPLAKINPDEDLSWYNDMGYITAVQLSADYAKSAQAFGDWTGSRWAMKYTSAGALVTGGTVSVYLTGQSSPFSIEDYRGYDIRRFNESWNATDWMKNLYVQPHIQNNTVFWDGYINSVIGTNEPFSSNEGDGGGMFGRAAYERIANYVANHADIDVSNIDQLYSLAQKVDVPIDDYGLEYPPELKRLMDIVSVNQQYLWGARCVCKRNIENEYKTVLSGVNTQLIAPSPPCCPEMPSTINVISTGEWIPVEFECKYCGHKHPGNRGDLFDPLTYTVTSYESFVVKDNYVGGDYTIITPPLSCNAIQSVYVPCQTTTTQTTCVSIYSLSASYNFLLPDTYVMGDTANYDEFVSIAGRYCFYDYVDVACNDQIAGVINWDDPYTTLDEHTSGSLEWFGGGQLVEKMLNYILHKGLGLLDES